ncbi:MAG TPA: Ig-like domain repeat protein [Pyrinomonadaceae bacterium]|nr:Ig-like domain repeat protein [Pyrinomonadaceae bacterium]
MKNYKSLSARRVFVIFTFTLLLLATLGLAVIVGPTTTSAAASSNVAAAMTLCTTDPVVTNNLDAGAGSLRQAIIDACDGSTITFNMATVTSPISLTTAELTLNKNLTITGPGSTSLTIERSSAPATPQFRIFNVSTSSVAVNISGVTVTNGHPADGTPGGFSGGSGVEGGGIRNLGQLVMSDVRVIGNQSGNGGTAISLPGNGGAGGGIYNEGSVLTMTNSVVSGNRSGDGGGGGTGSGGGRGGEGAGIYTRNNSTTTLTNVVISNNTGGLSTVRGGFGGMAGGIYIAAPATVIMNTCVVSNNTAGDATGVDSTPAFAGGIYTEGLLTITNSTISGNSSKIFGGGIMNRGGAVIRLTNSTLSGNSAIEGGAINNDINGFIFLTNCTITNNSAQRAPGIITFTETVEVRNTIIAGNDNPDVAGRFISRGNNLIGSLNDNAIVTTSGFTNGVNNDQVGTVASPLNPWLGPLANNGGPTQTHALLSNSTALDAGNNCVLDNSCSPAVGVSVTTDQRGAGFARAADSADANLTQTVDIGAFEAQVSVEDIPNKSTTEDTPISFSFNIGEAAAVTSVTATSGNTAVVPNDPANLSVTGSGSTRTLNITPAANQSGLAVITVTVNSATDSMSDTFVLTVSAVADTPSVTSATTSEDTQTSSGLVITRSAADNGEVTHFRITGINNGTLFKNNGTTPISNGDFITVAEGNAGLKFTPAANAFSPATSFGFSVEAALSATGTGISPPTTATITVDPVAETPSVTNATTFVNTQTTSGLVITRNAIDGAEITHFKITNITNGTLFKNNGTTQITNNSFITSAEANAGLRFTPASNLSSPGTTFSFQVQGATNASGAGLGPAATASITVNKRTPTVALASSANPSDFGQSVTFTATVSSASGTPTGTVQFKDGGSNLGPAVALTGGTAQLTTAVLATGNHVITADYSGDAVFETGTETLSGGQTVKAAPTLSINDVSIAEGNSGTTNLSFTVTLSAASAATINVGYATADGTALTIDNDYQGTSGTLTFNPGDLTKPITVVINGDQKTELDETVLVNLSNAVNAVIADAQGVGTILNDDTLQLLLEESGPAFNQATALDSMWFARDPFQIPSLVPHFDLGTDHNRRLMIFAANLTLNQGDTAAAVTITLVDGNSQTFTVSAEDVRSLPNTSFSQVVFRLPNTLAAGNCLVTINLHGQISNTGTIRIAP